MDINLELYKVFYYVATTLSFSEASRQLFISQSAVSQAVKNLEKKLGHTLFVRRPAFMLGYCSGTGSFVSSGRRT